MSASEGVLENEDDLINEYGLKNEEDLKNEADIMHKGGIKITVTQVKGKTQKSLAAQPTHHYQHKLLIRASALEGPPLVNRFLFSFCQAQFQLAIAFAIELR